MRTEAGSEVHAEWLTNSSTLSLRRQSGPTRTRSSELLEILHLLQSGAGAEQFEAGDLQLDMADVAAALADLEAEIEAIAERGRQEAENIQRRALHDVRRIDDEVDFRALEQGRDQPEVEQRTIMQRAAAAAERARRDAHAEVSEKVAAATALIWDAVTPATTLRVA